MGTLRLYELPREVQKLIGRSGGILPPKFRNFTASQVGSEAIYRAGGNGIAGTAMAIPVL